MFCTFLLAQKGTQKRPPQSIYGPIAGRSFNQHKYFGSINFSNSTLRAESFNVLCSFNINDRYFNSTTRYEYIFLKNVTVSISPSSNFFTGI